MPGTRKHEGRGPAVSAGACSVRVGRPGPCQVAVDQPVEVPRALHAREFGQHGAHRQARIVAQAMKTYGMIVADNGSAWFISGVPSPDWDDEDLSSLGDVPGSAWEVVDSTKLRRPGD